MDDIYLASDDCLSSLKGLYKEVAEAEKTPPLIQPSDVQACQGRFKVWCANLVALQQGSASLDYRLREFGVMHQNVLQLLRQLKTHVIEASNVIADIRPAFEDQAVTEGSDDSGSDFDSDDEQGSPGPFELEIRLSRMDNILTSLYKLGYQIRSPHQQTASRKALTYSKKNPNTERDILDFYTIQDRSHVESLFASLRQFRESNNKLGDPLRARLAASITARRRQFQYWEDHAKKLSYNAKPRGNDQSLADPAVQDNRRLEEPGYAPTLPSTTEASNRMPATIFNEGMETATVVTTASTARDLQGRSAEFPAPPSGAQAGDFICPYCKVLCPHKYSIGKAWKTHVLHDLRPYVSWLSHEASAHRRVWECRTHAKQFDLPSDLEIHFRGQHLELQNEDDLHDQVSKSYTDMTDSRTTCPVCLMSGPFHKGLENHLANHLERVALFALPRNTEDSENSDNSNHGSDIAYATASQSSNTELQDFDQSDSQADDIEEPAAEGPPQESNRQTVAQALEMARDNSAGEIDPVTSSILEDAIAQISFEIQSHPDSYIMTDDEFAVFSYFQHRFQDNKAANDARSRYLAAKDTKHNTQDNVPPHVPAAEDTSGLISSDTISWGPWSKLRNGQWHREGHDTSGSWYEENRDEKPESVVDSESTSKGSQYIVETSRKFTFGTVFKVMWSEPMGNTRLSRHNKDPVGTGTSIRIRRFIVIDGTENGARNGNSICMYVFLGLSR
ncbi:hypothetical protein G7054_g14157 [Neopestalotiopsis clavispora]|nr:hypothetical protein G7054_g14157 [Neopestalotiopsis clavispora]